MHICAVCHPQHCRLVCDCMALSVDDTGTFTHRPHEWQIMDWTCLSTFSLIMIKALASIILIKIVRSAPVRIGAAAFAYLCKLDMHDIVGSLMHQSQHSHAILDAYLSRHFGTFITE